MPIDNLAHNWAFTIYVIAALGLCSLMLVAARYLGGRSKARAKHVPYESGLDSVGTARIRFSSQFYLVAMFFVIFDVEALFLFAWAASVKEAGWIGFIGATVFIITLLAGLYYLVRIGALDWVPERSKRNLNKIKQSNIQQ